MSGLEGDPEPELIVDSCLIGRLGGADDIAQVAETGDEGPDVIFGEPVARHCGGPGRRRGRGLRRVRL